MESWMGDGLQPITLWWALIALSQFVRNLRYFSCCILEVLSIEVEEKHSGSLIKFISLLNASKIRSVFRLAIRPSFVFTYHFHADIIHWTQTEVYGQMVFSSGRMILEFIDFSLGFWACLLHFIKLTYRNNYRIITWKLYSTKWSLEHIW